MENIEKNLKNVLEDVKNGLGIEEGAITPSLYKLLVYEKGDFFLPHKDSEKEPGMFGTLVIGLPSAHTGGELVIRFDGREEVVDFARLGLVTHYVMGEGCGAFGGVESVVKRQQNDVDTYS